MVADPISDDIGDVDELLLVSRVLIRHSPDGSRFDVNGFDFLDRDCEHRDPGKRGHTWKCPFINMAEAIRDRY